MFDVNEIAKDPLFSLFSFLFGTWLSIYTYYRGKQAGDKSLMIQLNASNDQNKQLLKKISEMDDKAKQLLIFAYEGGLNDKYINDILEGKFLPLNVERIFANFISRHFIDVKNAHIYYYSIKDHISNPSVDLLIRATIESDLQRPVEASILFHQASELGDAQVQYIAFQKIAEILISNFQDYMNALIFIKKALEIESKSEIDPWMILAKIYQELILIDDLDLVVEKCQSMFPDSPGLSQLKGVSFYMKDRFHEALEHYFVASKFGIITQDLYYEMGYCYFFLDDFDSAIDYFQRAITINPFFYKALRKLAECYVESRNSLLLLSTVNRIIDCCPEKTCSIFDLLSYYTSMSNDQMKLIEISKQIDISEDIGAHAINLCCLGFAYIKTKNFNDAKKSFETALTLKQGLKHAYIGLSTICMKLDEVDYELALQYLLGGYTKNPKDIELNECIYEHYFLMKRYDEAEVFINNAIAIDANNKNALMAKQRIEFARKKNIFDS
jgi:tetratricopeptide (TPR) repeat protein